MERLGYHDLLAGLGIGSAHPGGFDATIRWTDLVRPVGLHVLDVGCGTGRTACYLTQRYGCSVTGIDLRRQMIEKARRRAYRMGLGAQFAVQDILSASSEEQYDLVVAESVTVFLPLHKALKSYFSRVRPGGRLVDLGMMRRGSLPGSLKAAIGRLYEAQHVPTVHGWREAARRSGFTSTQLLFKSRLPEGTARTAEATYPDWFQEISDDTVRHPDMSKLIQEDNELMRKLDPYLQFAALVAQRTDRDRTQKIHKNHTLLRRESS